MNRLTACGLALLAACAARPAPPPTPPAPALPYSVDQVTHAVDVRDAAIRTLRARFTATVKTAAGERQVNGVVLVAKPERLRFRLSLAIGMTVFDYLRVGDSAWLALPLGGDDQAVTYAREALPRMFDRFLTGRPLSRCDTERIDVGTVSVLCSTCLDTCLPDRAFRIRAADAAIEEDQALSADGVVSITRYEDYRAVDGAYLPYRIVIVDPRPDRERIVEVAIERYEVNPVFDATMFAPSPGSEPIAVDP